MEYDLVAYEDAIRHKKRINMLIGDWQYCRVGEGTIDGPGYENRHRKPDYRTVG